MSNERRLQRALQGFVKQVRDDREYGTLGRVNADGTVTLVVAERPDHVYVRMNAGALITLPNVGKGRVALRAGLPVQMIRLANGDLVLDGQNDRLLEGDANAPDVDADLAYHAYLIEALTTQLAAVNFLILPDTPADYVGAAGMAATVNATEDGLEFVAAGGAVDSVNGQTGVVILDADDLAEGATHLFLSAAERSKLLGIAAGAEVNVNADWNAASGDALILNKPTVPTNLDSLTDVIITTPSNGEILSYDGSNWVNSALSGVFVDLVSAQSIGGAKTFTAAVTVSGTGQMLTANRNATANNQLSAVANFKATYAAGAMADGYGTGFFFRGQDSDGIDNTFVLVGGVRDGADNSGLFRVYTYNAGVASIGMDITATNVVILPSGRLQVKGNTGPVSGMGLELGFDGTDSIILSYDRGTPAYKKMRLNALSFDFEISNVDAMVLNATGLGIGATPLVPFQIKYDQINTAFCQIRNVNTTVLYAYPQNSFPNIDNGVNIRYHLKIEDVAGTFGGVVTCNRGGTVAITHGSQTYTFTSPSIGGGLGVSRTSGTATAAHFALELLFQ